MGLKLGEQKTVKRVDGSSPSFRVKEFSALVGEIPISSSLLAMDLSGPSRSCHRRIDGIVGVDFIRNRIVQIDFARQILRLLEPAEATTAGYEMIPLAARNDTLCARVSVNGRAAQWLRLDTGCNTSVEWVARDTRSIGRNATTIGVNLKMADEILTEIQIGAKRIASVKTGIHGRPFFPGEFGLIGNGLLSHFVVTIDAANRRCLLAEQ